MLLVAVPGHHKFSKTYKTFCAVTVPLWSPFGVQPQRGCVRGTPWCPSGRRWIVAIPLWLYAMVPVVTMGTIFSCFAYRETKKILYIRNHPTAHLSRQATCLAIGHAFRV
jgi:hypothetical protein